MSNCRFPSATPDASGDPYGNLFGVLRAALRLIPSKYTEGLPGWLLTINFLNFLSTFELRRSPIAISKKVLTNFHVRASLSEIGLKSQA
ncbi:hypothetical protein QUB56_11890 [Microcoleus sp. AR_TQ3_B6]|uniref:hypothetical protein n=1 Tax=Microcoleus sp. AR_TQ3_B6 TaxID=3055284 RepID=UPI002FD41B4B